ncbi:MAG: DNA mismatch endonuclease Vsr [Sedimentisphaerales bacterium]|nr:DNA mismatch endonuclease Vsr [Sedimentisphaerales bacterium]
MSHNKGKDTTPEVFVRKQIYSLGFRYRLHRKNLPGCPDMVFPGKKKVIFVNGCYWHRHNCKKGRSMPATRKKFWQSKFQKTILRDRRNLRKLRKSGWRVLTVWECQIRDIQKLSVKLSNFLTRSEATSPLRKS